MQKTKKLLTIGITAIVFLWTLAVMPAPASAATLNVPSDDYPTIQAAINAAVSGDTVLVAAGTYTESITMKPFVTIQGSGPDVTTIDGNGSDKTIIGADDSTISGFTITGSDYGIYNDLGASPKITNNIITGNVVGIWNFLSSAPITNNIITGNLYGIYNWYDSSPTITNNTITGNNDSGIYNYYDSSPTITNNTITGNNGSGIYNYYDSSPTITNNIITGGNHGIKNYFSSPTITYNNLWGYGSDETAISNDITSTPTVANNIDADPMFEDPSEGDYHLQAGSLCIDAGSNDAPGLPETDFDGNPRKIDGDNDGFDVVDMGAFEYQVSVVPEPLASFGIKKLKIDWKKEGKKPKMDKIKIDGSFELPAWYSASDLDPYVTVIVEIGDSEGTDQVLAMIKKHHWDYKRKKHEIPVGMNMDIKKLKIKWDKKGKKPNKFKLDGELDVVNDGSGRVTVTLLIPVTTGGDLEGIETLPCKIHKHHWEYKVKK